MLNLFMQLVKRDNRGIAQSIVVIGMVVIVTGALIFTIPSARNAVNNMWGVAASMVQRIDPAQSLASNSTTNPSSGSTNNQTPVSGSSSTTEPITNPVQPPVSDTTTPAPSTGTQPSQGTSIIDPAQGKQPVTGVETGSGTTIGNPKENPVQPPVSDGTSSTTSPSTTPSEQTQPGYWVTQVNPDGTVTRYFVPTPSSSGTPVGGTGSTTEPITKPVQPPAVQ